MVAGTLEKPSTDMLYAEQGRKAVAAFAFDPGLIARTGCEPDDIPDTAHRSMCMGLKHLAIDRPGDKSISGDELEIYCRSKGLDLFRGDDETGRVDQFSAREFDLATEDGGRVHHHAESIVRALQERAMRRDLTQYISDLTTGERDVQTIVRGLRRAADKFSARDCRPQSEIVTAAALIERHPHMREVVVDNVLRRGEVANIISAAKIGKSWLAYLLALSVAVGRDWLGRLQTIPGRVLICDNELHPETLAFRISTVAKAMGLRPDVYGDRLHVVSMRGRQTSIHGIGALLQSIERDYYSLCIIDAFYRTAPDGTSENDNNAMTAVYNAIDSFAEGTGAAFALIHHSSKGSQADKSVTDVGAGAGAQSRAADSHLILRPHEQEGCVVLDAAVRSFPPLKPLALRWEYPLWIPDEDLDPEQLKRQTTRQAVMQEERDREGFEAIIDALRTGGPSTQRQLRTATGIGRERLDRLLSIMQSDGRLQAIEVNASGNHTTEYRLSDYLQTN